MKFSALVSATFVAFAAAACKNGEYSCEGNTPAVCSNGNVVKMGPCGPGQNCTVISGNAVCKEQ